MIYAISENILSFDEAMDNCIVQKILPKINGSSNECYEVLVDLLEYFNDIKLEDRDRLDDRKLDGILDKISKSHTSEKIVLMIKRFVKDSFTSFW